MVPFRSRRRLERLCNRSPTGELPRRTGGWETLVIMPESAVEIESSRISELIPGDGVNDSLQVRKGIILYFDLASRRPALRKQAYSRP